MALDPGIKAIGFDMDGTIMDTDVDYVKLAHVVEDEFVSLGVPEYVIDQDRVHSSMDHGIQWLKENRPESLTGMEQRIGDRATVVELENSDKAVPMPGALDLITGLRERGYKVGLLTRGGRRYANKILGMYNMAGLFDAIVARDDYPSAESKPSRKSMEHLCEKLGCTLSEIVYVGDSTVDWKTATNSGSPFIGVMSGNTDIRKWRELTGPETVLFGSVADILKIL